MTPPLEAVAFGLAVVGGVRAVVGGRAGGAGDLGRAGDLDPGLVAVLPNYALDFGFAWRGGNAVQADGTCPEGDQNPCALALANMTGPTGS